MSVFFMTRAAGDAFDLDSLEPSLLSWYLQLIVWDELRRREKKAQLVSQRSHRPSLAITLDCGNTRLLMSGDVNVS